MAISQLREMMTLTYYSPGFARCCLEGANLIANLDSCLGGLRGKALDFLGYNGEVRPNHPRALLQLSRSTLADWSAARLWQSIGPHS
ncbi:hypothetical protein ABIA45_007275 [Bradyrhizobium sp. USDA 336]